VRTSAYVWDAARRDSETFWRKLLKNPTLRSAPEDEHVARLNDTLAWYGQNALVHLSTPYGLEQYSGAAWGLRDVCQGPVEFLLATRNFDSVKSLLKKVYAHQLRDGGDWPQWFMLDRYQDVYAPDSYADIIVWPMKAICDYVEATNNLASLDEVIGFACGEATEGEGQTASLFSHTLLQIEAIEARSIPGTALAAYGHGDWEDSLQPVDPAARQRCVSPWTVELIYQTFGRYAEVCARAGKRDTCERLTAFRRRIHDDFNHYLVKDGVTAGLVDFGPEGIEYLLHPDDQRTGVHYRLLPMTRGIISGIFSEQQMRDHLAFINEHLMFPDGVRLMDRPVRYHGGTETLFKRAESAANFGREIGLQYVHAHIRYVEAMTKLGRADEARPRRRCLPGAADGHADRN
jgi:1,2-beta-oligoglucan phosphorylase